MSSRASRVGVAVACLPLAIALVMAPSSGGYALTTWGPAALLLVVAVAVVALSPIATAPGTPGWIAIGGALAFACWQGISSAWADDPNAAITAMNRSLLFAAAFVLVLITLRRGTGLRALSGASLVVITAIGIWAVTSRLVPALVPGDDLARLATGLSYWNALGMLLAFGLLLAIGFAGHDALPRWGAAAAGACVPLLLTGIALTASRGSVAALLVGMIVLIAAAPRRIETICTLAATALIAAPIVLWITGESSLTALGGTLPPHDGIGAVALMLLIITMAAAGAATWALAWLAAQPRFGPQLRTRIGWGITAVSAVVAVTLAGALWPAGGPVAFAGRQLDAFRAFAPSARAGASSLGDLILTSAGSGRWQNWTVAVNEAGAAPLRGTGAGDYQFWWNQTRPIPLAVHNAHSLYLETLGESGVIGLVLLLVPIAVAAIVGVRFLVRSRGGASPISRDIGVALAACSALFLHAGVDWDWQFPTLMLPGVALTAGIIAVASSSGASGATPSRATRAGIVVAAVLALPVMLPTVVSARTLAGAYDTAEAGDLRQAVIDARYAADLNPADAAPWLLLGDIADQRDDFTAANAAYAAAFARSPRDADILTAWTASLLRQHNLVAARDTLRAARVRNPLDPRVAVLTRALNRQAAGR